MSDDLSKVLSHLDKVLVSRLPTQGGDPQHSYVASLYEKGPDAFLKKIGEEGAELIMACKDKETSKIIAEAADLWFHSLVALHYYGISSAQVLSELARREGVSGLVEKAARQDGLLKQE